MTNADWGQHLIARVHPMMLAEKNNKTKAAATFEILFLSHSLSLPLLLDIGLALCRTVLNSD